MWELLNNARNGWGEFIYYGKYPALLLLVLVVFWFFTDRKKEPVLMGYTTIMTVCCICPLTAVILMQYQTKFYDYQWIWNYVPLTMVLAFAGALVLDYCKEAFGIGTVTAGWKEWFTQRGKMAAAILVLVVLVLLCGRMSDPLADAKTDWRQTEAAEDVVAVVNELAVEGLAESAEMPAKEAGTICLLAPKEVMAAARIYQPQIQLPYGRDLWDASLGAYTYDTYTQTEEDLCQWIHCVGVFGTVDGYREDSTLLDGKTCVKAALDLGVNRIVVPGNMLAEEMIKLEEILESILTEQQTDGPKVQVLPVGNYYLFTWN